MKSFFSNKIVIALIASFSVATVLFCIAPIGLVYDVVFYFAAFAAIQTEDKAPVEIDKTLGNDRVFKGFVI